MAPSPGLKDRVLAAATGQKAARPAMLTRVFWSAAAVLMVSFIIANLFQDPWRSAPVEPKAAQKATGLIRWKERSVKLDVTGLPPLPVGKIYQLWHIGPQKDFPVGEGTFPLTAGSLIGEDTMAHDIVKGHLFAVTVEPEGGSKTPTMPIYFVAAVK